MDGYFESVDAALLQSVARRLDGKMSDAGEVGLGQREVHVALTDRRHPVPALAGQARHRCKRHLLASINTSASPVTPLRLAALPK